MSSHDARPAGLAPLAPDALPLTETLPGALADTEAGAVGGTQTAPVGTEAAATRGAPEWRQLSFRASGLTIELEITGSGDERRLMGQLIPRQPAAVDIRHPAGVITTQADALGRFSAEGVPLGQISLRCRLGPDRDQSSVVTGWITL